MQTIWADCHYPANHLGMSDPLKPNSLVCLFGKNSICQYFRAGAKSFWSFLLSFMQIAGLTGLWAQIPAA